MTSGYRDKNGKLQIINVNYFRQVSISCFVYLESYFPTSYVHTVRSYQFSGGAPRFLHAPSPRPSKEYRAGFVDSLSRKGDRGPCRARRCQDGVLLRCNRADGDTPEMVADSQRHRKQSWDLTRRDCRMSNVVFYQVDSLTPHKISNITFRASFEYAVSFND